MNDPGQLVDRGRALQQQILRAGGPPPHLAAQWRRACRVLDQADQQLRSGLGLAWFLLLPLLGAVGLLGYIAVKVTPDVIDTTKSTVRALAWVLVGGTALLFAGAAKRLGTLGTTPRRRRKAAA